MSQLTNIPKQSYFSAQLEVPIDGTQTTGIILSSVPSYTPSGETVKFNILDSGGLETISATGWNSGTGELSGVTRALARYTGETAPNVEHAAGVTVVLSDDWTYFEDIQTAVNSKFDTAGGTMTGAIRFSGASNPGIEPNRLTTAERTALALTSSDSAIVFDTDLGQYFTWNGSTWAVVSTGTAPAFASETVAGISELATAAQSLAGTSIGETGARLVQPTSLNVTTSAGAGDAGKNPVLNASGILDPTILNAETTSTADAIVQGDGSGKIDRSWNDFDAQIFTSNGTWTKPDNIKFVEVVVIGAGGGGGSGERKSGTGSRVGGSGGGGGSVVRAVFNADDLGATETVTVGTGGAGGASRTTNSAGEDGSNGGQSSFGDWLTAYGGGGGNGGDNGTGTEQGGGGASVAASASGSTGGSPAATGSGIAGQGTTSSAGVGNAEWGGAVGGQTNASGTASPAGGSSLFGAPGGGAGGSATSDTLYGASAGGATQSYSAGGGGAAGADNTAGTAGSTNAVFGKGYCGTGGGGGGASTSTTAAGAGGAGGAPGAGGGGGGTARSGDSGAGGAGGRGEVRVYSW